MALHSSIVRGTTRTVAFLARRSVRLTGTLLVGAQVLGIVLLAARSSAVSAAEVCPVSGQPAKKEVALFQEGKLYNFCCKNCVKKFRSERENKLSEAEKKEGWKLVFNGKNLDGFQAPTRDGKWSVVDGVLTGAKGKGVLGTEASYDHFELMMDTRIRDEGERRGNSGVFIRSKSLTGLRGRWPDGPEIQLDNGDPNFWTGAIWKTAAAKKVKTRDNEWFQLRIVARGPRIRIYVAGDLVTDHTSTAKVQSGPIAFQVHHATDVVEFKNVKLKPLGK